VAIPLWIRCLDAGRAPPRRTVLCLAEAVSAAHSPGICPPAEQHSGQGSWQLDLLQAAAETSMFPSGDAGPGHWSRSCALSPRLPSREKDDCSVVYSSSQLQLKDPGESPWPSSAATSQQGLLIGSGHSQVLQLGSGLPVASPYSHRGGRTLLAWRCWEATRTPWGSPGQGCQHLP
jgi:hypothetical protein